MHSLTGLVAERDSWCLRNSLVRFDCKGEGAVNLCVVALYVVSFRGFNFLETDRDLESVLVESSFGKK